MTCNRLLSVTMHEDLDTALDAASAGSPVLVLAAHIDDEVIGVGTWLTRWPNVLIVHATDSSPAGLHDARRCGFDSREQYAAARRAELRDALQTLGAAHVRVAGLPIGDQQASFEMEWLTSRLTSLLHELNPVLALTHPYEGGHPDHDACAFALAHAPSGVLRAEFTSYHAWDGATRTGEFLSPVTLEHIHELSPAECDRKAQAFQCFATQAETLSIFRCDVEKLRTQPPYDFTAPPHAGQLNYERYPWGMTGERFRALAAQAQMNLRRMAA